jgi:hypothetical protein
MVLIGASAVMFVRVGIATAVLIGILLEPCGVDALYNLVQSGLFDEQERRRREDSTCEL